MIYNFLSSSYLPLAFAIIYAAVLIFLIITIAYYTIFERKILAAVQRRRGPNMVGIWGLLQALADGLKLLAKEPVFVSGANYYIFIGAPIVLLSTSLTLWAIIPLYHFDFGVHNSYSFVVVFLFSGLNSFAVVLSGLASNSRYSLIGGVRAIAQLISYEIPLSMAALTLFMVQGSFGLKDFASSKLIFVALVLPALIVFSLSLLAETNRTPFDLPEAEAELVAGYNLEYSSILFSLFFLAEYSNILVASSVLAILFFPGKLFYVAVLIFAGIFVLARAILPRYTYKQLMDICWGKLLPLSLFSFLAGSYGIYFNNCDWNNRLGPDITGAVNIITDQAILEMDPFYAGFFIFGIIGFSAKFSSTTTPPHNLPNGVRNLTDAEIEAITGVNQHNLFLFFVVSLSLVCFLVGINWVIVHFRSNMRKNSPYECGFEPVGSPISDFSPNFLAVALIFLIYDVEILLTFPWAFNAAGRPFAALMAMTLFVILMLLGLIYEIIDDSFEVV